MAQGPKTNIPYSFHILTTSRDKTSAIYIVLGVPFVCRFHCTSTVTYPLSLSPLSLSLPSSPHLPFSLVISLSFPPPGALPHPSKISATDDHTCQLSKASYTKLKPHISGRHQCVQVEQSITVSPWQPKLEGFKSNCQT